MGMIFPLVGEILLLHWTMQLVPSGNHTSQGLQPEPCLGFEIPHLYDELDGHVK